MGTRIKARIASGAVSAFMVPWGIYSQINTAADIPEDAGKLAKMLADPPIYLPWLILLGCIAVIAWSLWPGNPQPEADPEPTPSPSPASSNQRTSGPHSPNIGAIHGGNVYFGAPPPAPTQERKKPNKGWTHESLAGLERAIRGATSEKPPGLTRSVGKRKPDISLTFVLVRVYKALGGAPAEPAKKEAFRRRVNLAILDAAAHQGLTIWGRVGETSLDKICEGDIRFASLDHIANEMQVPTDWKAITYSDLHFNKAQVDRVWPESSPTTTNAGKP